MLTRAIIELTGRIQGVGFRDVVEAVARQHPVAGFVRNRRPPEVLEIDVEGETEAVDAFLEDVLAHAPPHARVAAVRRTAAEPAGHRGFVRAPTV